MGDPMIAALIRQKALADPDFRRTVEMELVRRTQQKLNKPAPRYDYSYAAAWEEVMRFVSPPPIPNEDSGRRVTCKQILAVLSRVGHITKDDILSSRRQKNIVHWRHIAMETVRRHTRLSYPEIGRRLGNRHHSTVIHGVRTVRSNPALYAADIKRVEALL